VEEGYRLQSHHPMHHVPEHLGGSEAFQFTLLQRSGALRLSPPIRLGRFAMEVLIGRRHGFPLDRTAGPG
jgi:hypothetical protein